MAFIEPSGTLGVYGPRLSCAVPYCTASAEAVPVYATQNVGYENLTDFPYEL